MAVTRRTYGTKSTVFTRLTLNGASLADVRDTLREATRASFESRIADVELWAAEIARAAGLDPERPGIRLVDVGEQTAADHADEILCELAAVRSAIASGNADDAARHAMSLGVLIAEVRMKKNADMGWKRRAIGRIGSEVSATRRAQKARARNKRMARDFIRRWEENISYPEADRDWRSPKELKVRMGQSEGLNSESQAQKAINDGLKSIGQWPYPAAPRVR